MDISCRVLDIRRLTAAPVPFAHGGCNVAWTKSGPIWIDRRDTSTAFLAVPPETDGAQPLMVCAQVLIRLPLVEAVAITTYLHLQADVSERSLSEVGRRAIALYEKMVAEVRAKGTPTLACQKGCSFCCRLNVSLTRAERLLLLEHLKASRTCDQLAEIGRRARAHQVALRNILPGTPPPGRPACPLLEDGACSVYETRPLHCRGANSRDARQCESGGSVNTWPPPLALANSIICGLDTAFSLFGLPAETLQLSSVLAELS